MICYLNLWLHRLTHQCSHVCVDLQNCWWNCTEYSLQPVGLNMNNTFWVGSPYSSIVENLHATHTRNLLDKTHEDGFKFGRRTWSRHTCWGVFLYIKVSLLYYCACWGTYPSITNSLELSAVHIYLMSTNHTYIFTITMHCNQKFKPYSNPFSPVNCTFSKYHSFMIKERSLTWIKHIWKCNFPRK